MLQSWNANPESANSKKYRKFVEDLNLDVQKMLRENGRGEETAAFFRKMVNIPQGSYRVDQVPLYVDTVVGRFLFKYQKFATQVSRMFWRTQLKPFVDALQEGDNVAAAKAFGNILGFFGSAFLGGSAVLAARGALFGYADPGPDWDELEEAMKDPDNGYKLVLLANRAYTSMLAAGGFGFFGNYIQMGLDVADQQRVKNPMAPPGLASIESMIELVRRGMEQGKLTGRDIEYVTGQAFAFYRGYKRLGASAADFMDIDINEARLEMVRRDKMTIRQIARRFADESGIEANRTNTGRIGRTERSPLNQAIYEAIILGDAQTARALYLEAVREAPTGPEKRKIRASVKASMRVRQPILIGGAPSDKLTNDFMRWAKQNLPKSKVQLIEEYHRDYFKTLRRAGL
jgi:hypothetical protein